jgi:hypothetical protein
MFVAGSTDRWSWSEDAEPAVAFCIHALVSCEVGHVVEGHLIRFPAGREPSVAREPVLIASRYVLYTADWLE